MADVEVIHLSTTELVLRRALIAEHLDHCCGMRDGTCPRLADYGDVEYLLGKDEGHGE